MLAICSDVQISTSQQISVGHTLQCGFEGQAFDKPTVYEVRIMRKLHTAATRYLYYLVELNIQHILFHMLMMSKAIQGHRWPVWSHCKMTWKYNQYGQLGIWLF